MQDTVAGNGAAQAASPSWRHYLTPLFEPASVAIVGATEKAGRVGEVLVSNMLAAGFRGRLYAVNPKHQAVHGVPCFASLGALPQTPDLAVIATPAPTIPGLIEDCGRAGVRFAVVITAGFGETGSTGAALEQDALAAARRHGVRIIGPNCLGLLRPGIGLNASFARGSAAAGGLALVSQSGAVCTAMLDWAGARGVGFSSIVSLGGTLDVGFAETLDYLAADPGTRHILLYVEGVRDARAFLGSLHAASRAKPVVLLKVGRHPVGSRAAVSHTGAVVGEDDVFEAALRRTGAVRVPGLRELLDAARVLGAGMAPCGGRLAIITNGGGPGVMAADRAADIGMPLAELSPATVAQLEGVLPAHWSHGNPLDLIGDADSTRYRAAISACLSDPGVDGLLVMLTPQAMTDAMQAADAVIESAAGSGKPVLACWMGEHSVGAARERLEAAGIPVFAEPEGAVEAFSLLAALHARRLRHQVMPKPAAQVLPEPDLAAARAVIDAALAAGRGLLDGAETRALLRAFRLPVIETRQAGNAAEAAAAAAALGFPVAMKIRAANITHKTEVGGVRLDLKDAVAVRDAYAGMLEDVRRIRPDADIQGVSIEPMASAGNRRELLVGMKRDSVFGPALTFGAGGTAVEVMRDRSVALPPLHAVMAQEMIAATRVAHLLGPFRGAPAADLDAIVAVLLRLSDMACDIPELLELDINPLLADEDGALVLDARALLGPAGAPGQDDRERGHLAILPYPRELACFETLNDGTLVELRPVRAEDAGLEQAFVHGLSPASVRSRFMHSFASLPPEMLERFVDIDYQREMAFVATHAQGRSDAGVGVARYVPCADGQTCEFAVVVADAWQNRGLATRLMRRLVAHARLRGLRHMVGQVAQDNLPMLTLCRNLGFRVSPWTAGNDCREVTLAL